MSGSRQPEHLWIANFAGLALLVILLVAAFAFRVVNHFQTEYGRDLEENPALEELQ